MRKKEEACKISHQWWWQKLAMNHEKWRNKTIQAVWKICASMININSLPTTFHMIWLMVPVLKNTNGLGLRALLSWMDILWERSFCTRCTFTKVDLKWERLLNQKRYTWISHTMETWTFGNGPFTATFGIFWPPLHSPHIMSSYFPSPSCALCWKVDISTVHECRMSRMNDAFSMTVYVYGCKMVRNNITINIYYIKLHCRCTGKMSVWITLVIVYQLSI